MGKRAIQSARQAFNVTFYKKLFDMVSDYTVQITFKKCHLRPNKLQLSEKTIKINTSLFPTTYRYEAEFPSYMSIKTIYQNRLNAEANMRTQLSSIMPDIKEIGKNVKKCCYSY